MLATICLISLIKKSSLLCVCKFLCLLDPRICFYIKRTRPWLDFRITFYRYSMKSFQKALEGFNNFLIHFIFIEFNWVSMSKTPSLPLQMERWARSLGSSIFFCSRGNRVFFEFPFLYILEWFIFDLCAIV